MRLPGIAYRARQAIAAPARRTRGFAMIALITLIAFISAYFIASAMSRTSTDVNNARDARAIDVMQQAKAALIAYAASDPSNANKQPGALPCPDLDDDGIAEDHGSGSCVSTYACCDTPAERIGRFPWKTVGTADLRDASGERLWYALSGNFRYAPGITVLNSNTLGDLSVTGTAPASNAVAVLLAPGNALGGQNRDSSSSTSWNSAANFLEGVNAGTTGTYTTAALASDTFNDRLIAITHADLFSVVEPVVAARMENDVKLALTNYSASSQWGAFPFPTAFDSNGNGPGTSATRAQSTYTGSTTQSYGLLPVQSSATYAWATGTGTLSKSSGTGTLTQSGTCAVNSTTKFRCTGILSNTANGTMTMTLTMDAEVPNVGQTLAKYTTYTGSTGSASDFITSTTATSWVSGTGVTVQSSPAASLAVSLLSTGNARVRYTVTVRYSVTGCPSTCRQRTTTFTIPVYPPAIYVGPIASPSDSQYGWFTSNEWYRLTYYAVTPSQLPGGDGSCASTANAANCLSVTGLSGSSTAAYKQGVMILMGRALAGVNSTTTRPSSSLDAYLEGQSPSTRTYQNRVGTPTTINDRVISLN